MTTMRDHLIATLWQGEDPFRDLPLLPPEGKGYPTSQHRYLQDAVTLVRPKIIVEVGVWKGVSAIIMGRRVVELGLDCAIVAVDTFLGSAEHWTHDVMRPSIPRRQGYPQLYFTFLSNVVHSHQQNLFVPMPLDSVNAADVLTHYEIKADIIHIDAGHDYRSFKTDIQAWWPLLAPGGILIGDDYYVDGSWPGVRRAFDELFGAAVEHEDGKCRLRKKG